MPVVYIVLTAFAYVTKDRALSYSLDTVYYLLMLLVNGIISIMLFTYVQLLIKRDECECIKGNDSFAKIHKTVHVLSYIILVGYGLYLMFYVYYKYIYEPKILLVDNGTSVKILNNSVRNGSVKNIATNNNLNQNKKINNRKSN